MQYHLAILLSALVAVTHVSALVYKDVNINVGAIGLPMKASYCRGERDTCQLLCSDAPSENSCVDDTLEFKCTCKNGTAPGLEYYDQSMPTHLCLEAYKQCKVDAGDSASKLSDCENKIFKTCGTLDANKAVTTSSAGSSPTTSSATGGSAPSTSTQPGAAATPILGTGAAAVALGLFAAMV